MSPALKNRNLLLAANTGAIASLVPVALHQLGALPHLPDPPSPLFNSDAITESPMAHPFGVPDALLGLASYATTLTLALSARNCTVARRALAAKLLLDGAAAAFNTTRQVVRFRRLCSWCMGTVAATAVMLWAARPLLAEALASAKEPRLKLPL